jgi:hypothetical protein
MDKRPERRQAARLTIPSQFSGRTLAHPPVRLVDLSLQGARIEHPDPLNAGLICLLDPPPALGCGSLTGRVVCTKPHRNEQTLDGARQRYYRSGLAWTGLTPAQQGALAAALELLKAAQEAPPPAHPAETRGEAPGESGEHAKGRE